MNDADGRALSYVCDGLPLMEEDYPRVADCTALGQAALLLGPDETAIETWYDAHAGERSAISRVLSRVVNRDDVADRVDERIAADPSVLRDLVRVPITWAHPAMPDLLDESEYRTAAAWMLAHTDADVVAGWLDGEHDADALVDVARAIAPSGVRDLVEPVVEWVVPVRDASPELLGRLEAALFVLDPTRWGRGFLTGDFDGTFLTDPVAMAELVGHTCDVYTIEALADAVGDDERFEAIARATAGAVATCLLADDDDVVAADDAVMASQFDPLLNRPLFSVPILLAGEEDPLPFVESAAIALVMSGGGLPRPDIEGELGERDVAELAAIARGDDVTALAASAALARRGTEEAALALIELWADGPPLRSPTIREHVYDALCELTQE